MFLLQIYYTSKDCIIYKSAYFILSLSVCQDKCCSFFCFNSAYIYMAHLNHHRVSLKLQLVKSYTTNYITYNVKSNLSQTKLLFTDPRFTKFPSPFTAMLNSHIVKFNTFIQFTLQHPNLFSTYSFIPITVYIIHCYRNNTKLQSF